MKKIDEKTFEENRIYCPIMEPDIRFGVVNEKTRKKSGFCPAINSYCYSGIYKYCPFMFWINIALSNDCV